MGNCVSPPAPPSIPPDHPFPLGRVHSSHPVPFGFWEKPPRRVPGSSSRPAFFGMSWADYTRLEGLGVSGRNASGNSRREMRLSAFGLGARKPEVQRELNAGKAWPEAR